MSMPQASAVHPNALISGHDGAQIDRLLTSLIFIVGGLGHFGQHQAMLDRMKESPWAGTVNMLGDPSLMLWLSGLALVVAGLTLAMGWMT